MTETAHANEIIVNGYTVIENLASEDLVRALRGVAEKRRVPGDMYIFGTELFHTHPELILPLIGTHRILDIAESLVGPFVQLDSFSVIGIAPGCSADICWHRDPFGSVPRGSDFQPPMAMNLLIYLQDLTTESGPLRVIPGSHRSPITMNPSERTEPHPRERLIFSRAGDGVLIHNNLVHSRTTNSSLLDRIHISIVYCLSCMKPTLDFHGPPIQQIVSALRNAKSRRLLRLFGEDPCLGERYNSGFLQADKEMWDLWIDEERAKP